MQYYTEINSYQGDDDTVVTLGKFDSLHRGHQKLIRRAVELSRDRYVKSVVFAFDMGHPSLLTNEERRQRLETKVDCMIECPFTQEIREMKAEAFIEEILIKKFHVTYIVVGTDFRFGHDKRGDVNMLAEYADVHHYQLEVLEKEMYGNREISSTYIREALEAGKTSLANELLGYPYYVTGTVEHGRRLGRTLGFPTMNVAAEKCKIMPKLGVYACKVQIEGVWFCGIGNVGCKPTVTESRRLLTEVFVFGYEGDTYGKKITVEFYDFERSEMKFFSLEELKIQVNADIVYGMNYFQLNSNERD